MCIYSIIYKIWEMRYTHERNPTSQSHIIYYAIYLISSTYLNFVLTTISGVFLFTSLYNYVQLFTAGWKKNSTAAFPGIKN